LGATGDGDELVLLDRRGRRVAQWDPQLPRNHLMELTLAEPDTVFALGSCGYAGGLSRVSVAGGSVTGGRVQVLVPPGPPAPAVCGERLSTGTAGPLAVAGGTGSSTGIVLVDRDSGRIATRVATPAAPVDVVVVDPVRLPD
jgi:hypothetical protein